LPLSSYLSEINGHSVSFLTVKQPVYGINQQPSSCSRVKKEYIYINITPPPRAFVVCFRVKF